MAMDRLYAKNRWDVQDPEHVGRLVGNTPLIAIHLRYLGRCRVIYAKCEQYNLTGLPIPTPSPLSHPRFRAATARTISPLVSGYLSHPVSRGGQEGGSRAGATSRRNRFPISGRQNETKRAPSSDPSRSLRARPLA